MVILNHTQGYIDCFKTQEIMPAVLLTWRLFVGMVVKIAVPLFFMISGSLLLRKDHEYKDVFKRILKMFAILLFFSLVANFLNQGKLYIPGFIRTFASADVDGARPYWYLYAYIGVLLMLPFLRYITKNLTLRDTMYLIVLRLLICGIIPAVFLILNLKLDSNIHLSDRFNPALVMVDSMFYVLIGYGMDRLLDINKVTVRKSVLLMATFIVSTLLEEYLTYLTDAQTAFNGFEFAMAISLFLLIKKAFANKGESKVISLIGSLTFGIYLLDPCVGNYLKPAVHSLYPYIPSLLLVSTIYCVASMIVCGFMTWLWMNVRDRLFNKR